MLLAVSQGPGQSSWTLMVVLWWWWVFTSVCLPPTCIFLHVHTHTRLAEVTS